MNENPEEKRSEASPDQLTFNAFLELLRDEEGLPKLKEIHGKLVNEIVKKTTKPKTPVGHKRLTKNTPPAKPKLQHLKLVSAVAKQKEIK